MAERRDRDNEIDIAQRVATLEAKDNNKETRIQTMEGRWVQQDKEAFRWLSRAVFIMGVGSLTGSMKAVKDKVIAMFPWLNP